MYRWKTGYSIRKPAKGRWHLGCYVNRMLQMRVLFILVLLSFAGHAWGLNCNKALAGLSKQELNIQLAKQAGLHYLDEPQIGHRREKKKDSFQYYDSKNHLIKNARTLDRIEQIRIPPGWKNVWISADPVSHIQATGEDEQGRTQAIYHELWVTEVRDTTKFERMQRFGKALPDLRKAVQNDLNKNGSNLETRLAAVVRLLEVSGIRIGGDKYAAENKHYGLSTLLVRHVSEIQKDSITLKFIGKKAKPYEVLVADKAIIRLVRELVKNKRRQDLLFDVNASEVNEYIKQNSGSDDFSAKDFRTWVASVTAAKVLSETKWSDDEDTQADHIKAASVAASEKLGNTWIVARDSYIDPFVFATYRRGKLHKTFNESTFLRLLEKKN